MNYQNKNSVNLTAIFEEAVRDIHKLHSTGSSLPSGNDELVADTICQLSRTIDDITMSASTVSGDMPNIAHCIDHTLLRANTTDAQILMACQEARAYEFAAVCVHPRWVSTARLALPPKEEKEGRSVAIAAVVGFPFGANDSRTKALETTITREQGATEIDMVADLSAIAMHDYRRVTEDIHAVSETLKGRATLKVIIEAGLLSLGQIALVTRCVSRIGCAFVKTSTGVIAGGAQVNHVALMSALCVGTNTKVKASGGIRDIDAARQMLALGAARIGTSSGISIVTGSDSRPSENY